MRHDHEMLMVSSGKYLKRLAGGFVCLALVMAADGCLFPMAERRVVQETSVSSNESKKYTEALDLYRNKDYEKSACLFQTLQDQASRPEIARMALYGLACSRLMNSDTPADYQEALNLWEKWLRSAPPQTAELENPVLLAPLIKEKMLFSHIPPAAENEKDVQARHLSEWLLYRANQELQRTRKQLEEAGRGVDSRDKKIKTLEKEIVRLNEQISAFEKIDQKIQKKKSAIPAAD